VDKITTITSKGQVTIPKAVRDALGLKPGDKIEFWVEDGRVKIRKANPASGDFAGSIPTRDAPLEEQGAVVLDERVQAHGEKLT